MSTHFLKHQHVPSISHALLNFLSAVAIINNGVREILPFIRYISQYVDFEWNAIKAQDRGRGVVCAATWYYFVAFWMYADSMNRIMPAALVSICGSTRSKTLMNLLGTETLGFCRQVNLKA